MKKNQYIAVCIATLMAVLFCGKAYARKGYEAESMAFSFEEFKQANVRLPYRQAIISSGSPSRLVVYLHGGTSRGNDNTAQLGEPGVDSLARFLVRKGLDAVLVVPQCPAGESWAGRLTDVLKGLITDRMGCFPDIKDVYLFGGSMGGTGTWTMISKYPRLFSAAMPVAGNPSKCDASYVAQTPFLTVMGTDDRIMSIETVKEFISKSDDAGARYVFEIENGWSHEDTCIKSYTDDRLDWVFSNSSQLEEATDMENAVAGPRTLVKTQYWTVSGIQVSDPSEGFYVLRQVYSDKSVEVSKLYIRSAGDKCK